MDPTRAWHRARVSLRWAQRHVELRLVMALAAIGGLTWAFVELTGDVLERDTHALDTAILLAFRDRGDPADPLGPVWMHEAGRDITALGSPVVLVLLTAATFGYLWLSGRRRLGWILLAGAGGAALFMQLAKEALGRPRPDVVSHLTQVLSPSFPSGHSTMSAAIYLVLGMLLARLQRGRALRAYVVLVAVVVVVLVGVSRVYVGVHWPTDVLAGWTLGTAWAIAVWTASVWRERPRERAHEGTGEAHA